MLGSRLEPGFQSYGSRRSLRNNKRKSTVTLLLVYVVFAIALSLQYESVTAFTISGSPTTLGLHRRRVDANKNNQSIVHSNNSEKYNVDASTKRSSLGKVVTIAYALCSSPILRIGSWRHRVQKGYNRRINADPSFLGKSITEVLVAAGTQLMAEWNRRGASRMIRDLDFVLPAILTAVFGKYYR